MIFTITPTLYTKMKRWNALKCAISGCNTVFKIGDKVQGAFRTKRREFYHYRCLAHGDSRPK